MQYTTTYRLSKPDYTDIADISVLNANLDIIDQQLADKVTLGTAQNITGFKTFLNNIVFFNRDTGDANHLRIYVNNVDQGTNPTDDIFDGITWYGKTDPLSNLQTVYSKDGSVTNQLRVWKCYNSDGSKGYSAYSLGIKTTRTGSEVTAFGPTPKTASLNNITIPTMAYLNSESLATYLVHRAGAETLTGVKTFTAPVSGVILDKIGMIYSNDNESTWTKIAYTSANETNFSQKFTVYGFGGNNERLTFGEFVIAVKGSAPNQTVTGWWSYRVSTTVSKPRIMVTRDSNGVITLWGQNRKYCSMCLICDKYNQWGDAEYNMGTRWTWRNVGLDYSAYPTPTTSEYSLVYEIETEKLMTTDTLQDITSHKTMHTNTITIEYYSTASNFKIGNGRTDETWYHVERAYGSDNVMVGKNVYAVSNDHTRRYFGHYTKGSNGNVIEGGYSHYVFSNGDSYLVSNANLGAGHNGTRIPNMQYLNNPEMATYLVHRSGAESISGNKTFLNRIMGDICKGRITSTDSLDIDSEHDGMNIYYLYMNQVNSVKGTPVGIEGGGAILYHSREYGWGDSNNNYIYYHQMLISSTGIIFTRRHTRIQNKSTNAVTWGTEKWKKQSYTEVDAS